jgi:nucleotide sugar dehydrogenase
VTVVGLGKIGLPLAAQYASRGAAVIGADVSGAVVETVASGRSPFPNEPGLESLLQDAVARGALATTTDTAAAVSDSDVVVVTVPVVVDRDGNPTFEAMDAATSAIGFGLRRGTLVIFETTLPVGTTRNRLIPILARRSGLAPGDDFLVCYSPERVMSGSVLADLRRYPKTSTPRSSISTTVPTCGGRTASGISARWKQPSSPSSRRRRTET